MANLRPKMAKLGPKNKIWGQRWPFRCQKQDLGLEMAVLQPKLVNLGVISNLCRDI